MMREYVKRVVVGLIFGLIGWFTITSESHFVANSEPASLIVLQMDSRQDSDGISYRPVLGLNTDVRPRPEYSGNTWTNPPLHAAGEIVEGRYDIKSGKMKSNRQIAFGRFIGWIFAAVGAYLLLTAIGILFGVRPLD